MIPPGRVVTRVRGFKGDQCSLVEPLRVGLVLRLQILMFVHLLLCLDPQTDLRDLEGVFRGGKATWNVIAVAERATRLWIVESDY